MINYYQSEACAYFDDIIAAYPSITFFQPSPNKAPWHVQAILDVEGEEPIVLNFWPHKMKAQRQPCMSVEGIDAIHAVIQEALEDQASPDVFDLIED
jgi:hypothetical protein